LKKKTNRKCELIYVRNLEKNYNVRISTNLIDKQIRAGLN